eukprot:TRINITY_DN440_c0_g2_i2.p1 TRINITY_DN440_c0_g2~~TRINITY_DN440_c0_g2_i2.p1  ORF type:complete len:362 (-),score=25.51 TRINITY_DN440_c0_g2_i2:463-1548(-)
MSQAIPDNFESLEAVQTALRVAGLESSNLIIGVDFTKSNEWTGQRTFGGRCLHALSSDPNPYEQAISIIGRTLEVFDEDRLIPCFGFGDISTHDEAAFSFNQGGRSCEGFEEVLKRYREIAPAIRLAGPTSFAPIIQAAVRIVEENRGQYHVLLIIADGQVTRSCDLAPTTLSPQEQATVNAIVAASNYALSIVMVGVGDGPWDTMRQFDDNIPARQFDNFQFVDFTSIMLNQRLDARRRDAAFALAALMEIPQQFSACNRLGLIGRQVGRIPLRAPLEPPAAVRVPPPAPAPAPPMRPAPAAAPAPPHAAYVPHSCAICMINPKNMVFQCGHQTCRNCGPTLRDCPICRTPIVTRINLYG